VSQLAILSKSAIPQKVLSNVYRVLLQSYKLGSNIVKNQSEDVVLDEERISRWFENEVLHEGLGRIIISIVYLRGLSTNIVKCQSEHIMSNEPASIQGFQNKTLSEPMRSIFISLQLS